LIALIPARKESRGLPGKNRVLLRDTLDPAIKSGVFSQIVVTTDDSEIVSMIESDSCYSEKVTILDRPTDLAADNASMRDVVEWVSNHDDVNKEDIMVLYLTFPSRNRMDLAIFKNFWEENPGYDSMIGFKQPETHPYLCYSLDEDWPEPFINHGKYRRQDYPKVWEVTHVVCVIDPKHVDCLDNQMIGTKTLPYELNSADVTSQQDRKYSMPLDLA